MSSHSSEGEGLTMPRPRVRGVDRATAENFLPRLIEAAMAAVIVMDEHGAVTAWNHNAEQTFGWSAADAVGSCLVDLVVPSQFRDAHTAGLERFRQTGQGAVLGQVLELSALHRDGHEFPVELRISPAARVEGVTLFIAFVVDISERRAREAELVAAYEEARASRQAIDEFVSMVVHDLRQPMAVTMGYADLLLDGLPAADEARYRGPLSAILRKSQDALALINEVLTAAKLDAGGLTARREVVDLAELAAAAVRRAEPAARLRQGTVSMSAPLVNAAPMRAGPVSGMSMSAASVSAMATNEDQPRHRVVGDPAFLDTIIDNLINNAITYSPERPAVHVEVRCGDEVEVLVSDAGKGVAPEMHERIFERFVRGHDRSKEPGTGLGLYVARHLAERQGGSLRLVSSQPGVGSVFSLQIPAAAGVEPAQSATVG